MTPAGWAVRASPPCAACGGSGRSNGRDCVACGASGKSWYLADHLRVVNRFLLDLAARRIRFLMVFMPPRHGKSELISKYLPGWWLGTFPEERVILSSYEGGFAHTWGRKVRDTIEESGQAVFGITIRQDSKAANRWDLVGHEGGMVAAGVGGPITGKGAHLFIMDDPIKNPEQAYSKTYRERAWDWWRGVAMARLEPSGVAVMMMTRWHQDDLAGRLIKAEPGEWVVLRFPAIAEHDEAWKDPHTDRLLWQRPQGNALWPARFPRDAMLKRMRKAGGYLAAAEYQQNPSAPEGNIFRRAWFRYFRIEHDGIETYYVLFEGARRVGRFRAADCWRFQTCDPAATSKDIADWFVLSTWAVTPNKDLLLLDVYRDHVETTNHERTMSNGFTTWKPKFQGVERETFGLNIIQACKKAGLPVRPLPAEGDKVARSRTMAARYEIGAVYHLEDAAWRAAWEEELVDFPTGEHDDQVDTASYAGIVLVQDIGVDEEGEVEVSVL